MYHHLMRTIERDAEAVDYNKIMTVTFANILCTHTLEMKL